MIHGWPVVVTPETRPRYARRGTLVDEYHDDETLLRDLQDLLLQAAYGADKATAN
jgi:hypothetical protein